MATQAAEASSSAPDDAPVTNDTSKLRHHICEGEGQLVELNSMVTAAIHLVDVVSEDASAERQIRYGSEGAADDRTPTNGLAAVIDDIANRVDEIHSWWRQLHELGVVGSKEGQANG